MKILPKTIKEAAQEQSYEWQEWLTQPPQIKRNLKNLFLHARKEPNGEPHLSKKSTFVAACRAVAKSNPDL